MKTIESQIPSSILFWMDRMTVCKALEPILSDNDFEKAVSFKSTNGGYERASG